MLFDLGILVISRRMVGGGRSQGGVDRWMGRRELNLREREREDSRWSLMLESVLCEFVGLIRLNRDG